MFCGLCHRKPTFEFRSEFSQHLKTAHNYSMFPCPFCEMSKEFDTELKLYLHIKNTHWLNEAKADEERSESGSSDESSGSDGSEYSDSSSSEEEVKFFTFLKFFYPLILVSLIN